MTGIPGGPLIPGRQGRKGCAAARMRVKQHRRRLRRGKPSSLPGSEKPQPPKPGVYFSSAPAPGYKRGSK